MHPGGKMSSRKFNIYTSFLLRQVSVPTVSYDANTMHCHHCWSYISQLQHFSEKHRSTKVSNMLCALSLHSAGI